MKLREKKFIKVAIGIVVLMIGYSCSSSRGGLMGNMVAVMQVKEPIPGVCDNSYVVVLLPYSGNGQVKAIAPKTDEQIAQELNSKVEFLKDKPNYEDKGMVSLIINCKGELVQCKIDNKTMSPELDSQIVAVFAELKTWTPGTLKNSPVDSVELFSFTIKNGVIILS